MSRDHISPSGEQGLGAVRRGLEERAGAVGKRQRRGGARAGLGGDAGHAAESAAGISRIGRRVRGRRRVVAGFHPRCGRWRDAGSLRRSFADLIGTDEGVVSIRRRRRVNSIVVYRVPGPRSRASVLLVVAGVCLRAGVEVSDVLGRFEYCY